MKKVIIVIMVAFTAFIGGFAAAHPQWFEKNRWEFQRGIGSVEVRADYDLVMPGVEDQVFTQVILWDEEYENYRIQRQGFYPKNDLTELSEQAAEVAAFQAAWN